VVGRKKERHAHDDVPDAFERAVSYVDTVEFLFKRALNKEAFKRFRLALLAATRPFGSKYVRKRVPSANGYFIVKIVLHRPTADSLRVFEVASLWWKSYGGISKPGLFLVHARKSAFSSTATRFTTTEVRRLALKLYSIQIAQAKWDLERGRVAILSTVLWGQRRWRGAG
jgi:hypothetical protein